MTTTQNEKQVDWLGTVRARLGYLIKSDLLLYGTGGLAFGSVTSANNTYQQASGLLAAPTLQFLDSSSTNTRLASGYVAGAGFEWMFSPSLSLKAEYLYYDLGPRTENTGPLVQTNFTGLVDASSVESRSRYNGHIVRAGLNYHFNGSAAADSPELAAVSVVDEATPTIIRWTGAFAGFNAGYSFDRRPIVTNQATVVGTDLDRALAGATIAQASAQSATVQTETRANGVLGGGTIGYNRQFGRVIVGAEADIDGSGLSGKGRSFGTAVASVGGTANPVASLVANERSLDWMSTVRGRIGYLITPRLLVFGTGGLAVGGVSQQTSAFQLSSGPVGSFLASSGALSRQSSVLVGWSIGGGIEYMLTSRASIKAEYICYDLGSSNTAGGTLMTTFGLSNSAVLRRDRGAWTPSPTFCSVLVFCPIHVPPQSLGAMPASKSWFAFRSTARF